VSILELYKSEELKIRLDLDEWNLKGSQTVVSWVLIAMQLRKMSIISMKPCIESLGSG